MLKGFITEGKFTRFNQSLVHKTLPTLLILTACGTVISVKGVAHHTVPWSEIGEVLGLDSSIRTQISPFFSKLLTRRMSSCSINLRSLISVCNTPLGMESGAIKDAQITASTQWDDNHATSRARLNLKLTGVKRGAWSTRVVDLRQWLQVDLLSLTIVTGVATQGRNAPRLQQWVTKYRLQYSNDGVNFHFYKEKGDNSFKVFSSFLLFLMFVNRRRW